MLDALPRRAFFRFELPIHRMPRPPRIDGDLRKWSEHYRVPVLVGIEDRDPIADVYWAWHDDGFVAAFDVPSRGGLPECDPREWWKKDGLRLCIDTRDTRDLKRGTRFCHFFYVLPLGGGSDGRRPVVGFHRMSRARESPPAPDVSRVGVAARVDRTGYTVEVGVPAECLHGWDPAEHARIGVFYKVKDVRLGSQTLTVTDDLGWNTDPSTWATGVLID